MHLSKLLYLLSGIYTYYSQNGKRTACLYYKKGLIMTEKVVILALYLVGTNCMAYMFLDII